jgi:hypothetical protein
MSPLEKPAVAMTDAVNSSTAHRLVVQFMLAWASLARAAGRHHLAREQVAEAMALLRRRP